MYVKIHRSGNSKVIAICDENLINKEFEEGSLYIKVSESFFKGEKKNKEDVKKILKEAGNVNFIGGESVSVAIESGLISKEDVKKIKKIPYAFYFGA